MQLYRKEINNVDKHILIELRDLGNFLAQARQIQQARFLLASLPTAY
jgi:hypothetical protein